MIQDNGISPYFLYRGGVGRLLGEYDPQLGFADYNYWIRLSALFNIAHISTDTAYDQHRARANALWSRVRDRKIFKRANRRITYASACYTFYQQPWTIYADTYTLEWLNAVDVTPHTLVAWTGSPVPVRQSEKILLLLESASLPALAQCLPPAKTFVSVWFGQDATAPYRHRADIQRLVRVCFAPEALTRQRLELFTRHVFPAEPGQGLFDAALAYANDYAFHTTTSSAPLRQGSLPVVYTPTGQPLRVLLQVDDFIQGGLEQVVLDLAVCLGQEGIAVCLLVLGKAGQAVVKAQELGLTVLTLAAVQREAQYRQLLTDRHIDLVNAHYSLFGAAIAGEMSIPFVQTIHNTYVWFSPQQIATYQEYDRYTTAYICVSNNVAFYADVQFGLPVDKIIVLPNGINTSRLEVCEATAVRARLRQELGLAAEDFVFLNVASLSVAKAQKLLVQAMLTVVQYCPRAKLVLLGRSMDDAYVAQIKREIAHSSLDRSVIFAGYHEEVAPFYRMADAFVLPSFWEGWSLALAEALYANLPVVVSDVGGAPEQVLPVAGYRVPPPFGTITALNYATFDDYTSLDQPHFVEELAVAMQKMYAQPLRFDLPESFRQGLDWRHAYGAYGRLFHWLRQRGELACMRWWR